MCETTENMTIVKSSDTILAALSLPVSQPNRNKISTTSSTTTTATTTTNTTTNTTSTTSIPVKTTTIPTNTGTTIQQVATVTAAEILQSVPFSKPRLQELVREIDPTQQLDDDVEEALLQVADDFLEHSMNSACRLASHRKGTIVEVRDVQLHLQQNWKLWVPGFGYNSVLTPPTRTNGTEVHRQRMAIIRKAMKK